MDETGRAITVALEDPRVALSPALQERFGRLGVGEVERLLDAIHAYLPRLWDAHDALPFDQETEAHFRNVQLPSEWALADIPDDTALARIVLSQLEEIPIRWRVDVLGAITSYLNSMFPSDEHDDKWFVVLTGLAAVVLLGFVVVLMRKRGT